MLYYMLRRDGSNYDQSYKKKKSTMTTKSVSVEFQKLKPWKYEDLLEIWCFFPLFYFKRNTQTTLGYSEPFSIPSYSYAHVYRN